MANCNCPNPTAYSDIPTSDCPFDLKQLQRVAFQQLGFIFDGTAGKDITLKADWDALKVAADATKVVASPLVGGEPAITAGEAITEGGNDNSTLNGVTLVNGTNPASFTARFDSLEPSQEVALKQFMCRKNNGAYFVNEEDNIIAEEVTTGSGTYKTFAIQSYFFGDRTNEGFGTKDSNTMTFQLKAGWSEKLVKITPEAGFSPLADL